MCLENMREAAFAMIVQPGTGLYSIVSSSDSTDRYEMYLNEGADFVILGEAELTLLELINTLALDKRDYFSVEDLRSGKVEQS
jgi:radical SAM superfamily enzyme YgiQ (UPF0313 family)